MTWITTLTAWVVLCVTTNSFAINQMAYLFLCFLISSPGPAQRRGSSSSAWCPLNFLQSSLPSQTWSICRTVPLLQLNSAAKIKILCSTIFMIFSQFFSVAKCLKWTFVPLVIFFLKLWPQVAVNRAVKHSGLQRTHMHMHMHTKRTNMLIKFISTQTEGKYMWTK